MRFRTLHLFGPCRCRRSQLGMRSVLQASRLRRAVHAGVSRHPPVPLTKRAHVPAGVSAHSEAMSHYLIRRLRLCDRRKVATHQEPLSTMGCEIANNLACGYLQRTYAGRHRVVWGCVALHPHTRSSARQRRCSRCRGSRLPARDGVPSTAAGRPVHHRLGSGCRMTIRPFSNAM